MNDLLSIMVNLLLLEDVEILSSQCYSWRTGIICLIAIYFSVFVLTSHTCTQVQMCVCIHFLHAYYVCEDIIGLGSFILKMHILNMNSVFFKPRDLGCIKSCSWSRSWPCTSNCGGCRGHCSKWWFGNLLWWKRCFPFFIFFFSNYLFRTSTNRHTKPCRQGSFQSK